MFHRLGSRVSTCAAKVSLQQKLLNQLEPDLCPDFWIFSSFTRFDIAPLCFSLGDHIRNVGAFAKSTSF